MRRVCALLLAGALLLSLFGCQHVSDAYSPEEEQAMKDTARELAAAWLSETVPDAVLGSEETTYCDIVTDWSKYYLSGYVKVPYFVNGEEYTLMADAVNGQLYSDEDMGTLTALVADWLAGQFGLPAEAVLNAEIELWYALPVTYEPTQAVGKFPFSKEGGYLPVGSGNDLAAWLADASGRAELEISADFEVADGANLAGLTGRTVRRLEEKDGVWFSWLRAYDRPLSVIDTLKEDGGMIEAQYAAGDLGPFLAEYLSCIIEELPQEDGSFPIERMDFILADCVRVQNEGNRWVFTVEASDDDFNFTLLADGGLAGLDREWTRVWPDGATETLHWERQEDGRYLLVNAYGEEAGFWESFTLTVS